MKRGMLWMSRVVALSAALLWVGRIPPASSEARTPTSSAPAAASDQGAEARMEVRLRKLHLVRPDLIPYPIHYDVYC